MDTTQSMKNTICRFKRRALCLSAAAVFSCVVSAQASTNLVTNGGFESLTNGPGQLGNNTTATGWDTTGYNFVFAPGAADTTGSQGVYGSLTLWGPKNGSSNGLPATSPDGGNFVAADGAFDQGAITQTISGLIAGNSYTVSFYWAGAQQYNYAGGTTEQWKVKFGSQTQTTPVLNNSVHGFTGWKSAALTFTASGATDVLSFLAVGTPNGEPPFSLLDGVSVTATPEPGFFVAGLGLMGLMAGMRFRSKKPVRD